MDLVQLSEDYRRIADALTYLHEHYTEQPDLETLSRRCSLSPFHFQRIFTRWAGISPKRFVQHLTVEHAKRTLRQSAPVLEAAYESGLSGPGRLHDLFVACEGVTEIRWGVHPSPLGPCVVAVTGRGICGLSFARDDEQTPPAHVWSSWKEAEWIRDEGRTRSTTQQLFDSWPEPPAERPALHVRGTNFQISVWRALLRIPVGALASYGTIAKTVGKPTAARAAAGAVGRNPVAYLIPCHRVIRNLGRLGGYRWGLERKTALLGTELGRVE